MNNKNTTKLALFLTGIENRLVENADYFKSMNAVYKSGTKSYKASIALQENKISINFCGKTEVIDINAMSSTLSHYAMDYDSVCITYEERGTIINIEADNKDVKMTSGNSQALEKSEKHSTEVGQLSNRNYIIKVDEASELLKEIGILSSGGKIKNDMIRKYNQIDHFIELIKDMIDELAQNNETITAVDCGCGKSYLSFVLNYYIKEVLKKDCFIYGIDYSEKVIEASKNIAKNLGYKNMKFDATDIKNFTGERNINLLISLHACDTATDEALALAVRNNIKSIVVVPCCHKEILSQLDFADINSITKHGILKARISDALTDGLRALYLEALGYKVSVVEYISPLETPKNLMIRAIKTSSFNKEVMDKYKELKKLLNVNPSLEKFVDM